MLWANHHHQSNLNNYNVGQVNTNYSPNNKQGCEISGTSTVWFKKCKLVSMKLYWIHCLITRAVLGNISAVCKNVMVRVPKTKVWVCLIIL